MRRSLAILICALAFGCFLSPSKSRAQERGQCMLVETGAFEKALAEHKAGNLKGQIVQGDMAKRIAKELGFVKDVVAVALIDHEGGKMAIVAIKNGAVEIACFADVEKAIKLFGHKV